jgi:hypothetical protein
MASTDALPVPQKNVAYRVTFPIFDADGDLVTGATGLDSEISKDGGTFADCTNEATEIATSSGMYFLDLTSTEMNADCVAIIVKTTSVGAKTTPLVLYPAENADIKVNVVQVAANAISDAAVAADMDSYTAKVWVIKEGTTADHYAVRWFKNGAPITSGITSPTIQVIKGSDGTDLIASGALTEIGSTHRFKKDESTNKMVGGAIYFAVVAATIDGSTRTWDQQVGRDSA